MSTRETRLLNMVTTALLCAFGCTNPSVPAPKGVGFDIDTDLEPPSIPMLSAAPASVPWPAVTLRGSAMGARRVIVESGVHSWARSVLPDGTFCIDAPMAEPGVHTFTIWAQGMDGGLSVMPATVDVENDPSAPAPSSVTRCDGSPIAECATSREICDNGRDDDCNGLIDVADEVCRTCSDDILEPNESPTAPRIEPGSYTGLQVCAGSPDFYRVRAEQWDHITVHIAFRHADGDIDLKLLAPDGETRLESSVSVSDDEDVTFTADADGDYVVQVYGFAEAENQYTLEISVD